MKIKSCRVCHNRNLSKIGSLGDIAISDFTNTPQEGTKYPLTLVYCKRCTLLQLAHTAPRDLLYKNYWYESSLNPIIVNDLKGIAETAQKIVSYTEDDVFIDIGANDGTLLNFVKGMKKVGYEPAGNMYDIHDSTDKLYWYNYFENCITADSEKHSAKIITAIACLYDLPDPNKFMKKVKLMLKKDGIFIAQLMTLQPMIENNDVGNICHEHLEYYSYKSLVYLFEQNGLEIFNVEKNNINGGSYRIFVRHFKKGSIIYYEKEYGVKELKDFMKQIEENKEKMRLFRRSHYNMYGYGASTKANTILQYYNLNLAGVVDINPHKKGKYMINSEIPIIDKVPKDCEELWVFPYGFIEYFKKKEKGYKGKWITTIPEFKIYDN